MKNLDGKLELKIVKNGDSYALGYIPTSFVKSGLIKKDLLYAIMLSQLSELGPAPKKGKAANTKNKRESL